MLPLRTYTILRMVADAFIEIVVVFGKGRIPRLGTRKLQMQCKINIYARPSPLFRGTKLPGDGGAKQERPPTKLWSSAFLFSILRIVYQKRMDLIPIEGKALTGLSVFWYLRS